MYSQTYLGRESVRVIWHSRFVKQRLKYVTTCIWKVPKSYHNRDHILMPLNCIVLNSKVLEIKVLFCAPAGCKSHKNGAPGHLFMC